MGVFIEKIPNWIRWPLTPIVSAITFFVVIVIANLVSKILVFLGGPRGGISDNFFEYLINPGIATFCAVGIVETVAPRSKQVAVIVIAGLWIFLSGAITFISVLTGEWKSLLMVVAVIAGAGYAAVSVGPSST